jgi:hypothetical protein
MKKYLNGKYVEMTSEEIEELEKQGKEAIYQEHIRPRTVDECIVALAKSLVVTQTAESDDKTLGIQCMVLFEPWTKGNYKVGDVRTDPKTGYPYECIQAHNSTVNTDWDITVRTLWKPWHSKSLEYALPWEAPTGAHDMYKNGEYMIFTDKNIYKCIQDTNFSPTDYPQAWKIQSNV